MGTVATSVDLAETEGIGISENAMGRGSVPPKKCKKNGGHFWPPATHNKEWHSINLRLHFCSP